VKRNNIHAIVAATRAAQSDADKVRILRDHDSFALRQVLRYALDPRISWLLPEGAPVFKPLPENQWIGSEQMLVKEAHTLYLFVTGGEEHNPNVSDAKRQKKFVELLEYCHPEDARLLLEAKDRDVGIDPKIVRAAFPGLLPEQNILARVVESVVAPINQTKMSMLSEEKREKIRERKRAYARRKRAEARERRLAAAQSSAT
jgi:Family of unknown function (DUF6433)